MASAIGLDLPEAFESCISIWQAALNICVWPLLDPDRPRVPAHAFAACLADVVVYYAMRLGVYCTVRGYAIDQGDAMRSEGMLCGQGVCYAIRVFTMRSGLKLCGQGCGSVGHIDGMGAELRNMLCYPVRGMGKTMLCGQGASVPAILIVAYHCGACYTIRESAMRSGSRHCRPY
jgi:hypothetical protein